MTRTAAEIDPEAAAIGARLAERSAALDRALMARDAEGVALNFTEDAVFGESGMEDLIGRPAIRDVLAAADLTRAVVYYRLVREQLLPAGDRVVEIARFDETKQRPGQPPQHERGRVVLVWRRVGGDDWLIERLVVSDLPATG
jgi:ketosteroid isomerase-like protein